MSGIGVRVPPAGGRWECRRAPLVTIAGTRYCSACGRPARERWRWRANGGGEVRPEYVRGHAGGWSTWEGCGA